MKKSTIALFFSLLAGLIVVFFILCFLENLYSQYLKRDWSVYLKFPVDISSQIIIGFLIIVSCLLSWNLYELSKDLKK